MTVRKIFAYFIIFLFSICGILTFLTHSLGKTFLNPYFYSGPILNVSYDLLLHSATRTIYEKESLLRQNFKENDLFNEIKIVFPVDKFQLIMKDFSDQFAALKMDNKSSITLNLKLLRTALLEVAQRISSRFYASLPQCGSDELPQFNEEGLATCVSRGIDFNLAAGPMAKRFEKTVYDSVPDHVDLSFAKTNGNITMPLLMQWIDNVKLLLFITLFVLLSVLVFVVHKPFAMMVHFIGKAFLSSGITGFILGIGLMQLPGRFVEIFQLQNEKLITILGGRETMFEFLKYVFTFFINEIQRISMVFIFLGVVFSVLYFYLKRANKINAKLVAK